MWRDDLIAKCVMCGRLHFKAKEDVGGFPPYNIKQCDECKQVKLNTKGKEYL